jgi:hypothetical protein
MDTEAIVTAIVAAHALAVAIVNLTPTPKDNALLGKAYKVIEVVAGIVTSTAKQVADEQSDS